MKQKQVVLIVVLVVGVFALPQLLGFFMFSSRPEMGRVVESWETSNGRFSVRIQRHNEENGGFVPGAYYAYEAAPETGGDWRAIFVARHDDPNPISTDTVHFVSSKIGFVHFNDKYAVTLDGGESWKVWDVWEANEKANFKQFGLYPSIESVELDADGTGAMRLYSPKNTDAENRSLRTTDFGLNWNLE